MMASVGIALIALLLSLLVSFFYSGSETAVVSANRYRLAHLRKEGSPGAERTLALLSRSPRLLSTVLIGTNLGNVFAVLLFNYLLGVLWVDAQTPAIGRIHWSEVISLFVFTPILVIFVEILPKALFRARADAWIIPLRPLLAFSIRIFLPVIVILEGLVHLVLIPLGRGANAPRRHLTRGDLIMMLHGTGQADELDELQEEAAAGIPEGQGGARGGPRTGSRAGPTAGLGPNGDQPDLYREPDERRLIQNIIALEQTFAREIMQPLVELEAVRLGNTTVEGFKEQARRSGYSRFPVFKDRIVNLIGYVDIYDIIRDTENRSDLEGFVHPAYYVPETKRLDDLLQEFLLLRINNAIVVDEYGGCCGWITREDIIEEIVGELDDELDEPSRQIREIGVGVYEVDGRIDIDEINEMFSLELDDSESDTLAGYVVQHLDRIPQVGDFLDIEGWKLTVLEMEGHRVARIELRALNEPEVK
jgi:CBS domain containing-hemolysin-like protein